VVERDHPQTTINQTYIAQPGQPQTGDAGDKYVGLDRFGRVVDQNWVNATTGQSTDRFQYGYNQNGDVLYRQNLVNATMSELYQYDNLHQLISFQRGTLNATHDGIVGTPSRSQNWTPDALGNFTSVTTTNGGTPTTQDRTHNQQNEITSMSGAGTVSYDANGNLTADGSGNSYVYDAWNRLVAINNGGTMVASYKYDGLGRRITEIHGSNTRELYYSAQGQVLAEWYNGLLQARNVWSPVYVNALAYRDQARLNNGVLNDRFLVQQDADWNVTALVNPAGTILERYAYDPFGAVTVLNSNFTVRGTSNYNVPYGFQDMRYDWTVSVNIADNRVYSPTLMRWLQTDPIGLNAGNNDYAFVGDTPTDAVDPSGLTGVDWLTKGQYFWHWHHMLPQAVFTTDRLARHGLNLDINSAEFGWRLQGRHHIGEGGIHTAGWNKDWQAWFERYERRNIKVTKEMVLKQLEKMKNLPKYKSILALGKQATRAFSKKAAVKAAAKLAAKAGAKMGGPLVKKIAKRGGKAVPGVGIIVSLAFWPSDVRAKGWIGGTVNTGLDAVPFLGISKAIVEIAGDDLIPDLEEYDPEVYDAEETLPSSNPSPFAKVGDVSLIGVPASSMRIPPPLGKPPLGKPLMPARPVKGLQKQFLPLGR
ncbi:MAG TPA: RHS repeat-associated core domain-containing protein, partial [Gemmataceae bacterium]